MIGLFGCEYRAGRAASAPLLRPLDEEGREGGHSAIDPLPTFTTAVEDKPHDINVLPHMHSPSDMDKLFPTIAAAPEPENMRDYKMDGGVLTEGFEHVGGNGGRRGDGGRGRQGQLRQTLETKERSLDEHK